MMDLYLNSLKCFYVVHKVNFTSLYFTYLAAKFFHLFQAILKQ